MWAFSVCSASGPGRRSGRGVRPRHRRERPLVEATAGQGVRLPHLAAVVAAAERETGRRARAWEAVTRMGPPGGDNSREWNELGHTRALLHAADGDWQAALDDYMTCGAGQNAYDFVNPAVVPWRSGAALALVRLGRREEARELAEEELRHARTWGTARTVGRALRAYAAAVGGRLALSALTEGAELLRPSSAPVELVELLVDLGRAHLGRATAARAATRCARRTPSPCGWRHPFRKPERRPPPAASSP